MTTPAPAAVRSRGDLCPGVFRPWPTDDGLLVRLRLIGGRISRTSLLSVIEVSERYADGRVYLTSRANLQLRGLPGSSGALPAEVVEAIRSTGLLPTRAAELARNVVMSPQTGLSGGRIDLQPIARRLDRELCSDPVFAQLPGRFLFTLDDGRGDLIDRMTARGRLGTDLGAVAVDHDELQLRVGDHWGKIVDSDTAATSLAEFARAFLAARGHGPTAPWHIRELGTDLLPAHPADARLPTPIDPLPYGAVSGGHHLLVPGGALDAGLAHAAARIDTNTPTSTLIVTPWRGLLVPTTSQETR
ncbi:nitrite reductase [Gordonia sp. ABSL11-1]|uniref:nitrite reductase n=1 Tax=Gordonia sp. ABSL11-1 TaxID=3053924 RepID=UPI0025723350|nr:nitrite reductase [Gordonia sp. ABSL11-1]MDL9948482.1 nitrite reductase [Gordonia sp. ABSL11-1]